MFAGLSDCLQRENAKRASEIKLIIYNNAKPMSQTRDIGFAYILMNTPRYFYSF